MRTLTLAFCVVGAVACRRESCEPDIRGASPAQEEEIASAVDIFLRQLRPEYAVCVPTIDVVEEIQSIRLPDGTTSGVYRARSRTIELVSTLYTTVHHELGHALYHQNDFDLPESFWVVGAAIGHKTYEDSDEAFAQSMERAPVFGPLLIHACDADGVRIPLFRRAADYFDFSDIAPGFDHPGILATPAPFVERLRVEGGYALVDFGDALAVIDDAANVLDWTSFVEEPTFWRVPGRAMDYAEVDDIWNYYIESSFPGEEGAYRRVYHENDSLRLLGDGCLHEDELHFEWSGRQWSTWMDGDARVVGFWDMP